jgi:hypothetical protein
MSSPQPIALSSIRTFPGQPEYEALRAWPFADEHFYERQVKRLLQHDIPNRVMFGSGVAWVFRSPDGNTVGFGTLDICNDYDRFTDGKRHCYIPLLAVNPAFQKRGHGRTSVRVIVAGAMSWTDAAAIRRDWAGAGRSSGGPGNVTTPLAHSWVAEKETMVDHKRQVRVLLLCNAASWCLVVFMFLSRPTATAQEGAGQRTRFGEIDVERVNVISPAGKTVIAISNKERIAAPVVGGKTYPVAVSDGREHMAGMIFFNQDGDEMGGLVFNSWKMPNGRVAGIGHLSLDRFNDNQVVALQYKENAASVQAGLTFYDRPSDGKFKASLDLIEEARGASPERRSEIKKALAEMSKNGELGAERVFIGSKDRAAQLLLKDSRGRVRARLLIDAGDEAKLEFLDDTGKVIARFPG